MAEPVKTFDFDIQTSTTQISGNILPDGEAVVTFQVRNSGDCPKRAEVILEPRSGPMGPGRPENLAYWLQLAEPSEYDYLPQSHRTYRVRIKVTGPVLPGPYSLRILLVGHDDPDHECLASDDVSFTVAVPRINTRPFVIAGILLFLLITAGVIFFAVRAKAPSVMDIKIVDQPAKASVGQPVSYTLQLNNLLDGVTAENMVMDFQYPYGILGAWADVESDSTGQMAVQCGSSNEEPPLLLRCSFGNITPKQVITLKVDLLPGPEAKEKGIEKKNYFTFRWMQGKEFYQYPPETEATRSQESSAGNAATTFIPVSMANATVSGAAIPAVNIASVGKPVEISLIGWSNSPEGQKIELQYQLPQGMRFVDYPQDLCNQQRMNYFILICTAESKERVNIHAIPLQPSSSYVQALYGRLSVPSNSKYDDLNVGPLLPAVSNQLVFDGLDDWVQLGTAYVPPKFSIEMWVNPASLEDGQALIGAHRQIPGQKEVLNRFLVGYYNGSLNVNVMGQCRNLDITKTTDPFHLALVIDGSASEPHVTAYMNGTAVGLNDKFCCRLDCTADRTIKKASDGEIDFNWVIGQDWDADGTDIIPSDFFQGAISDVRIYGRELMDTEVREDMYLPPPLCSGVKEQSCSRPNLLGWWPLSQIGQKETDKQEECLLPKFGLIVTPSAATPPATQPSSCVLADFGPNNYDGARSGGSWESASAHFGGALAFDGRSALNEPNIIFSGFKVASFTITPEVTSGSLDISPTATRPTATLIPPQEEALNLRESSVSARETAVEATMTALNATSTPTQTPTFTITSTQTAKSTSTQTKTPTLEPTAAALQNWAAALKSTEMALQITETALHAQTPTVTHLAPTATPVIKTGVPVTMAAWIYVDTVPSEQQNIFLDSFNLPQSDGPIKVSVKLIVTDSGHVAAVFNSSKTTTQVTDEKILPAGRWIHYAVVFWYDKKTGELVQTTLPKLLLFRDGQRVKALLEDPVLPADTALPEDCTPPEGLSIGGLKNLDGEVCEGFTGRIDEVRIWNRALYGNENKSSNTSPDLELWRHMPGIAFDEYLYYSFDDYAGQCNRQGDNSVYTCDYSNEYYRWPSHEDNYRLLISGPSWVLNDLSIGYTR